SSVRRPHAGPPAPPDGQAPTAPAAISVLSPGDERIAPAVETAFGTDPPLTAALRSLWASLPGRRPGEARAGMMIALAGPGDAPVNLVAANFAVVAAQFGYRVLLVDAALEAPTQHDLFRLENRAGVSALLSGQKDMTSIVAATAIPGLSLLPAGPMPANAAELLEQAPLATRLRALSSVYEVIVIDTGAALPDMVALLASGADGAVMIVRRHRSRIGEMARLIERLADRGVTTLGHFLV
ncbi:MAG: hypothetical protein ABW173_00405, partial [Sphingomonas sp.]